MNNFLPAVVCSWLVSTSKPPMFSSVKANFFKILISLGSFLFQSSFLYGQTPDAPATLTANASDKSIGLTWENAVTAKNLKITFIGSSTAAGRGASIPENSFVALVTNYYKQTYPNLVSVNLAMGGYDSYRLLPTGSPRVADRPAPDPARNITAALANSPSLIICNIPSNDVSLGYTTEEYIQNLKTIRATANSAGVPIFFTTTQPRNLSSSTERQRLADQAAIIRTDFNPRVIDIYDELAEPVSLNIKPMYSYGDGIHLNDAGHAYIAATVETVLDKFLSESLYPTAAGVTATEIYRASAGNTLTYLAAVAGHINTYLDNSVTKGHTYRYALRAVKNDQKSDWSNIVSVDFYSTPPEITSFSPDSGPVGTTVVLKGTAFTEVTAVQFNGINARFTIESDTAIVAVVPSGATTGPLTVKAPTNPNNSDEQSSPADSDINHTFTIINLLTTWNARFGGTNTDKFTHVVPTGDGGYLLGGSSYSGVSGDKTQSSRGGYDLWVVKIDATGKKLWDRRFGGSKTETLNALIKTKDGGYLLGGSSDSGISGDKTQSSRGSTDYWIVKISATGSKEWDKRFGGSGYDYLNKAIQISTGEYVLAGISESSVSGDKTQGKYGGNDQWIIKLTSTGSKIWDKRFGGTLNEYVEGLLATADGNYLVAGYSSSGVSGSRTWTSQGGYDYWITKMNSSGTGIWNKRFGGNADDKLTSIIATKDGGYLLTGYSASGSGGDKTQSGRGGLDFWTVKIDAAGKKVWDRTYGGSDDDQPGALLQTSDGGYLMAGKSLSGISSDRTQSSWGSSDFWVVKTDGNGTLQWDQRFGGTGTDELRSIIAVPDGGYLLGGQSTSGISGDKTQASRGGTDMWLVKVTQPANTGTADATKTSARVATALSPEPITETIEIADTNLQAFPNPFAEEVTVTFALPQTQGVTIQVFDSQGRAVQTLFQREAEAAKTYRLTWRPKNQQLAGIYHIKLITKNTVRYQKVVLTR